MSDHVILPGEAVLIYLDSSELYSTLQHNREKMISKKTIKTTIKITAIFLLRSQKIT